MQKKKFIKTAKEVINLEIKALQSLKKINSSFNEAVRSIAKCQSKVILCGVGKSGLIASKLLLPFPRLELHLLVYLQEILLMGILEAFQKRYFDSHKLLWSN